ncbi:CBM_HP2_G0030400.mRNA.1.CDS.1 [Saccharomyces cerevisiae]|nr:ACA_G0036980.mRNA.1.CDS.1 [Saccharomyces cerevisiae]CAI4647727.1 ACA_G0037030.mRNA.1.CDS.1 [Saccharomyces cerevisiae]CAI5284063.1 CBM_HP2_G0030400.mRNA.1.CDS.1 [Saccharomyces cerevisiae]CAI6565628.1 CBM_HP2_G0030400.mRNA.1.CDS.1 [Saccharomyces cerevisiae]CAI6809613.1 ACA_G0036980.mRNA.1.CDS.1 [Saccharomyces cerevisiae]
MHALSKAPALCTWRSHRPASICTAATPNYFGCGHIYQKAPFPVRSTVVKLVRA